MIKDLQEYKDFEKSLKLLLLKIESDIITMKIDTRKTSNNINIVINKEEKITLNYKKCEPIFK